MLKFLTRLTLNQRLALLALVLGLVAIGATPTRGERVSVDSQQMALLVANESERVPARTLADWVIQGRADFRLVDVRSPESFAAGSRIPTAENIPVATLLDSDLARDEKILLVGDDDVTVAQAWFLLEAAGYLGACIVDGGMRAWRDQVVYPRVDGADPVQRARLEAVSAHFGGAPRIGGDASVEPAAPSGAVAQAAPAVPRIPTATGKKPAPAKKREGC
jgi:rhodanese-related sulfurtransferase